MLEWKGKALFYYDSRWPQNQQDNYLHWLWVSIRVLEHSLYLTLSKSLTKNTIRDTRHSCIKYIILLWRTKTSQAIGTLKKAKQSDIISCNIPNLRESASSHFQTLTSRKMNYVVTHSGVILTKLDMFGNVMTCCFKYLRYMYLSSQNETEGKDRNMKSQKSS